VYLPDGWQQLAIALERRAQHLARLRQARGQRKPPRQLLELVAVAAKYRMRGAARHIECHSRRHERIAVAIAANPITKSHEWRETERVAALDGNIQRVHRLAELLLERANERL